MTCNDVVCNEYYYKLQRDFECSLVLLVFSIWHENLLNNSNLNLIFISIDDKNMSMIGAPLL